MSWFSDLVGKVPVIGPAINMAAHNVVDPALRGAVSAIPGGSAVLAAGDAVGRMAPAGGSGGSDLLSKYGVPALMAAQGLNAANLGRQSTGYANRAMDAVQQSYDARAPLRAQGISRMLAPQTPSLAGLNAVASNNPYAPKPANGPPALPNVTSVESVMRQFAPPSRPLPGGIPGFVAKTAPPMQLPGGVPGMVARGGLS